MGTRLAQALAATAATSAVGVGSFVVMAPAERQAPNAPFSSEASAPTTETAWGRARIRREAHAATRVEPNEVGGAAIQEDAVGNEEIAPEAVTSDEVRDLSLLGEDFAPGVLPQIFQGETGPAGEAGPVGPPGAHGARGIPGEAGGAGMRGLVGARGERGIQGSQGTAGRPGSPGADGANGAQGPRGREGGQGPQGPQGPQGSSGAEGPAGPQGATGSQGPAGPAGPEGPAGPPGPSGGSSAREVYRDGDQTLPDNVEVTVATMSNVPAGAYVVYAKTTVVQTAVSGGAAVNAYTRCTLNAGGPSTDYAETELGRGDAWEVGRATLQAHVLTTFSSTGTIVLRCRRLNNSGTPRTAVARQTKIIAVEVGGI